jgi:hypothetical protein
MSLIGFPSLNSSLLSFMVAASYTRTLEW